MAFIMGVDGGGSKTYAVITDREGNRVGEGLAPGANYQKIGLEEAVCNIRQSMDKALAEAGRGYDELDFVQFTLAGADRETDFIQLNSGLRQLPLRAWDLQCDTAAGLRIGSADNVGVVLVCGSGTNAFGRSYTGKVIQTGGFGYLYGDYAGGKNLAIETFRAAVRSWERREGDSLLVTKVPAFFGFRSMEELLNDFLDRQVSAVPADLTVILHEAVNEGDPLATRLLSKAGYELGIAANSVISRIGDFGVSRIPVVLIGSVFQRGKNSRLLEWIGKTIRDAHPSAELVVPDMEPVFGAVLMGMDRLNLEATEQIVDKFNGYRMERAVEA